MTDWRALVLACVHVGGSASVANNSLALGGCADLSFFDLAYSS